VLQQLFVAKLALVRCAANRSDNFVVGVTGTSPKDSPPTLWNYEICGKYPGTVPSGARVTVRCRDNLKPFRYVVVQFPGTHGLNVCEIQVLVKKGINLLTLAA